MSEDKPDLKDDDFTSLYANNVQFETSVWDIKCIFGQLDQSEESRIHQHTAITLPWAQAKIAAYYLLVNIVLHEAEEGLTPISQRVLPPRPDPSASDVDDTAKETLNYLAWVHQQFFGPDRYVPPMPKPSETPAKHI